MTPSLYTPWIEPAEQLAARTVGRADELASIAAGVEQLLVGGKPLPLYFFGPIGVGKSHLLALAASRTRARVAAAGWAVTVVGEDVAQATTAVDLVNRLTDTGVRPAWMTWSGQASRDDQQPRVVFIEGLDRHLRSLQTNGQRELRAWLGEHPHIWLVATGARLSEAFVGHDAPFYGHFSPCPVHACADDLAGELAERVAGTGTASPRWAARRAAIVTLAGGNPRAIVALSKAIRDAPGAELADRLLAVLDAASANYHIRFNDLTPHEQRLVELLTQAPRLIGPGEAATHLGGVSSTWSNHAHRLADDGVLRLREDGRRVWYALTEPLFRYWLEYRAAPWEHTRIAWLGRLLELVLGPDDLAATWANSADPTVESAALDAMNRVPDARQLAWGHAETEVTTALAAGSAAHLRDAVSRAAKVAPGAPQAWRMVIDLVRAGHARLAGPLGGPLRAGGASVLGDLVTMTSGPQRVRSVRPVLSALLTRAPQELRVVGAHRGPRAQSSVPSSGVRRNRVSSSGTSSG